MFHSTDICACARHCTLCFVDPSEFKELRESEPMVFLQYIAICADYLGTLQNSSLDFYNHWISTDVIAERERLTGKSNDEIEATMRKMIADFHKFSYEMLCKSQNCAQETLHDLHAFTELPITELAEKSKFTEHFFAVLKNIIYQSGDAEIVLPRSVTDTISV